MNNLSSYKRNPDLLAVELDGETVMMDVLSGSYFGVNSVGSYIWELLETEQSVNHLVKNINDKFSIKDSESVEEEVKEFLSDLIEQDLISSVNK